ncbi:upstream activation factor subunit spp27-like [Hordeum vulgare]|nr:upstream activation factor subunit spp27-like [Hordeum vulgare]
MVSDSELVERLREVLRDSDLTTTTTGALRRRLEEDFGVDLSDKKTFVREQVDLLLSEFADKAEPEDAPAEEEDPGEVTPEAGEGGEEKGEQQEGEGEEEEEEEEEEDEEEEDEESGAGRKKKRRLGDGKKKAGGFTKLCSISPALQEFVGAPECARTEVVKKLWAYIRENNLQDPSNRRKILCDENLKKIFNVNSIDMFQMNKALTKHIWPLDSDGPVSPKKSTPKEKSTPKAKPQKRDRSEGNKQKGGSSGSTSGLLAPLLLSDDLAKFIGTGESMLSRSDVVKRMWVYIKENNLQDPSDRRKIICDEKLKDLFQVESFTGFTVSKLLNPHFTKAK